MRPTFFIALLVGAGIGAALSAKSLQEGATPVNFPPADFAGGSFVDNDGCIYIRAGVDGATTWVPRVARDRQVVCGREPTFGAPLIAAAPAPAPETARPVPRQATATAEPVPQTRPAQRPARVAAAQPAPRQIVTAPTRTVQPTPQPARRVAPAPVLAAPVPEVPMPSVTSAPTRAANGCGGAVQCAPQSQSPSPGAARITRGFVSDAAPRLSKALPPVPEGYKRAWTDGRLNPQRGIPTQTAPRATVSTKGPAPRVTRPAATVSETSKTLIQAGTFSDMGEARAAAQRLANAGMPTRIGKFTRGGQARQVILLGPFKSGSAADKALRTTRAMGFARAVLRK